MASPIFLYPTLSKELKDSGIFQGKKYSFSYTDNDGYERNLEYEAATEGVSVNCLKTDGVWSADKNNFTIKRTVALKCYRDLFGPQGIACRTAKLGLSLKWTSSDSRQRGAESIMEFSVTQEELSETKDHTFAEGEIEKEFSCAKLRGDIEFSVVLYIAEAGIPEKDETHLANEEGFVLGEFDTFTLRIDGTGSLFPVFEVYEKDKPLWYVRCDWTDPLSDPFAESVSINLNTAHKNFKYIDRTQKTFCSQLLVEVMSSALCCIIEKIRSENYLEQILGDEEGEEGSIGEVIRYFAATLGWDFSTPDNLSLTIRNFFDRRVSE